MAGALFRKGTLEASPPAQPISVLRHTMQVSPLPARHRNHYVITVLPTRGICSGVVRACYAQYAFASLAPSCP